MSHAFSTPYEPSMDGVWLAMNGAQAIATSQTDAYRKQYAYREIDLMSLSGFNNHDSVRQIACPGSRASTVHDDVIKDDSFKPQPPPMLAQRDSLSVQPSKARFDQVVPPRRTRENTSSIMATTEGSLCLQNGTKNDAGLPPPSQNHEKTPKERFDMRAPQLPKKRKSSGSTASSSRSSTSPSLSTTSTPFAPRKTSHNMIEKRYRNNLNDKIAALRDAVPSLRAIMRHNGHENGEWNTDDIDGTGTDTAPGYGGLTPAHKLNKATVLSKAAEYIEQLEQNNAALAKDNYILRTRIAGLEMMMLNGQPLH